MVLVEFETRDELFHDEAGRSNDPLGLERQPPFDRVDVGRVAERQLASVADPFGAVLIAAVNAVAVAYLVFYDKITSVPYTVLTKLRGSPIDVTVIALMIVVLAAIAMKALTHRGTAFHGGLPSAHAAVAFAAWVALTFVAANTGYALPISAIALFMALLVAQSRIQSGIHSILEVAAGAALGIAITVVLFRVWYPL
jgi:diacylglycerol kinase (ATP)